MIEQIVARQAHHRFDLGQGPLTFPSPRRFWLSALPLELACSRSCSTVPLAAQTAALRGCSMFADLASDDLERIGRFVEVRRASRGDYLFREGEPVRGFFIIRGGSVNVHWFGADGTEKVIHVFRQGQSFAEDAQAATAAIRRAPRANEDRTRRDQDGPRLRVKHAERNAFPRPRAAARCGTDSRGRQTHPRSRLAALGGTVSRESRRGGVSAFVATGCRADPRHGRQ